MKKVTRIFAIVAVPVIALTIFACEEKQTKEAEMPEVKVEGGQTPEMTPAGSEMTPSFEPESKMTPAESEMAPSVEPESKMTPAESEMAPSVEPESEMTPAESEMTPSFEPESKMTPSVE